ncbi:hypothetical protein CYMTET_6070 [Cymbomonas tetramitiformis]|uniref:Uncharacterized protein n=1 Tax=Cymbomonas tetramitiformis TaxID=36881 RepID=A0AAE0GYF0_9CHLO|nr:hypothetical protein CYMTET_6070 [Cymbomonas tetramitiformis]
MTVVIAAIEKQVFARLLDSAGGICGNSGSATSLSETAKSMVEDVSTPARRRSARVNEDLRPAGDLLGVTYSGLFLGSCAFHGKDVVVVQSPLTNPFVEIACVETGALKTTAAAKSAASRREKSKATKKRERDDAEDEERVKKAKAQEEQQQRDDKKVRLAEDKARLAEEEKARKMEKALAEVASAAHVKHAVENTEKKIEQAVLLREHEMKVEAAEAERKRSAEVAEELRQQLQKQFLGACNAEAKKIQAGLKRRDSADVAEAEIELSVHRGIADGDIGPEEGEDGKSEKILELLTSWSAI